MLIKGVDPTNEKSLTYDQFHKNISKLVKLSYPEVYLMFKTCMEGERLSMKEFFKLLGGAA